MFLSSNLAEIYFKYKCTFLCCPFGLIKTIHICIIAVVVVDLHSFILINVAAYSLMTMVIDWEQEG